MMYRSLQRQRRAGGGEARTVRLPFPVPSSARRFAIPKTLLDAQYDHEVAEVPTDTAQFTRRGSQTLISVPNEPAIVSVSDLAAGTGET